MTKEVDLKKYIECCIQFGLTVQEFKDDVH